MDEELPELPLPQYPRDACPVCGYRPCSIDCRLCLSQWDIEQFEEMFITYDPPAADDEDRCDDCDEED